MPGALLALAGFSGLFERLLDQRRLNEQIAARSLQLFIAFEHQAIKRVDVVVQARDPPPARAKSTIRGRPVSRSV
jgi:hypothetical protein